MVIRALNSFRSFRAVLAICGTTLAAPDVLAQDTGLLPDGRLVLTSAADSEVRRYAEQVSGRYGALAVSQDGAKAVSYLCQSRLWKNCDDPAADDSSLAIPSGKVARDEALMRCRDRSGSACILLFVNDDQQREFSVQP